MNRYLVPHITLSFQDYNTTTLRITSSNKPVLIKVSFTIPLQQSEVAKLFKAGAGEWTPAEFEFYAQQAINDVEVIF